MWIIREIFRSRILLTTAFIGLVIGVASAGPPGSNGDVYVASQDANVVLQYDGATGELVGAFAADGGLSFPSGMVFRPNGNLLAVSSGPNDSILEFDGAGVFTDVFATLSASQRDIEFGPDGNLYVAEGSLGVRRYDGATGAPLGVFTSGSGSFSAFGLDFGGPDNNLFVTDSDNNRVLEYDGSTGDFIRVLANVDGMLASACEFGPNGHLFVGAVIGDVGEYDVVTGTRVRIYDTDNGVVDLTFRPDNGNLLAAEWTNAGNIIEFDTATGTRIGVFATGSGHPRGIEFKPRVDCSGDLDQDGDVDLADLAQLLGHYGTVFGATPGEGDLDGDGDVDLSDLASLLAVYGTTCAG